MYERSAIVLERYIEKILEFDKTYNLKNNYENYKNLIDEIENYQIITEKEVKVIQEFEDMVKKIEDVQQKQEKIYRTNIKLEEERNKLFNDLSEDYKTLEAKFQKIEKALESNNEELKKLRVEFTKYLSDFTEKQKARNKCEKARRLGEANHIDYIKKSVSEFNSIDCKSILTLKDFINSDKTSLKEEINNIMIRNGKNERVGFNQDVLKIAIKTRMDIAEKEAECYITIYDKTKKLLAEIESESLKLNKYKKALRDVSVKLAFLNAEKEYITGFLDYERMTAISGVRAHKKTMEEACHNFEIDIIQINNLYELILREVANKSTKKGYKELYNKTYLKNIEDKERNFEQEVNNIKIKMGTVINSNYWRIEGIKNIYTVFQEEVSTKFEKDLSEYKIEESEDAEEEYEDKKKTKKEKGKNNKNIVEDKKIDYDENYGDEDYDDEDYDDEDYDDEDYDDDDYDHEDYDDEDYGDEDYDDEDEYEDDEYEDDDYEDIEEELIKEIEKSRKSGKQQNGIFNKIFKERKKKK